MRHYIFSVVALICVVACTKNVEPQIVPPTSEGQLTMEVYSDNPLLTMAESGQSGELNIKSRGAEVVIDVVTNTDSWSYNVEGGEWLSVESNDYFLTVAAAENSGEAARQATIVITAQRGETINSVTIAVNQLGALEPQIALAKNVHHFAAYVDLSEQIEVETTCEDWRVEATCSWLFIERTERGLKITADPNKDRAMRQTTITLVAGDKSDCLSVSQDGSAFVELKSHNVAVDSQGGVKTIAIMSNPELEWRVEGDSDWFVAKQTEGAVEVTIDENNAGNQRFGNIVVTVGDKDNNATAAIKVHQIGNDTQELIYEIEVPYENYLYTAAPVLTTSTEGSITVNWGDGSEVETFEARRGTHTYAEPGLYTLYISGSAKSLEFGSESSLTTDLKNIISWGNLGYTTAVDMCLGCSALESIPNDVCGSFASVKSFLGAFSCCLSLKEIPAGLFRYATVARNFEDCFSHCGSVSAIPEGLLDNCSMAEDFSYAFYGLGTGIVNTTSTLPNFEQIEPQVRAGLVRSIPANLFARCPEVTQLDYVFGATAITEIPQSIFATCSQATTMMGAFSACVNLESIPQSLFSGADSVKDIKYMFAGCNSIKSLPVGLFKGLETVTNLEYIFYMTGVQSLQKGLFEGLTSVRTMGAVFHKCKELTTIEAGVFDGLTAATSFRYCFSDCTALQTVPEALFGGVTTAYEFTYTFENTALTQVPEALFAEARDYSSADFSYTFASCKNLKTVPAQLFTRFTKVTSPGFKYTFYDSGLESIPAALFAANVKVSTGFENTFNSCTALTSIGEGIFPQTTTVTSLAYTFAGCTSLKNLPQSIFEPLSESKVKFTATFKGCTALEELPEGLFAANSIATQLTETFSECTALKSVPATLIGKNEKLSTVKALFSGCTSLTAIPAEIFAQTPAITSFERTFASCSSLTSIPGSLFAAIGTKTTSLTFTECFSGCSSLTSLPAELFDTVRRISYIGKCFENCSSLTGESPYTLVGQTKVHLYERTKGEEFIINPTSDSAHADCFAGCTKLSDFGQMPSSWR